jgi:small subunit ribosomal protein S2
MSLPKLEELLEAGCHFGHLTRRWNPKMKQFIFGEKNGIHILDLKKTALHLAKACEEVERIAAKGETILFVGTKKQAQDIILNEAERSNNFYIKERWLGGTLTNFATVKKSIRKLKSLEKKGADGTYEKITKKEILEIERQVEKMSKVLGGIADMRRLPGAIFVVDTNKEHIAIKEAKKLRIPVLGLVDTNSDPGVVDYAIPANDDASKSIALLTKAINDAYIRGAAKVKAKKADQAGSAEDKFKKTNKPKTIMKETSTDNTPPPVKKEVKKTEKVKETEKAEVVAEITENKEN